MTRTTACADKAVSITYSITDVEDNVIEQHDVPVTYIHGGKSKIFPEIERALQGRTVDDHVSVTLSPAAAFGPHREDLTIAEAIANVPPQYQRIGAEVQFQNESGDVKTFVVSKIEDGMVTLDGNHPFAGKAVTFHVTVVAIRDATPQEIGSGEAMDAEGGTLQ
ncbi:MAG: peptidylprolyl isomerase [Gammaproteobacteria bacterium]|nr:peptidylprolyl isomerase [Gammaproteobacteria bacterium]MCP5138208.1 peptidylprolyl isomerase [Gammaproteobacteria bacterium]